MKEWLKVYNKAYDVWYMTRGVSTLDQFIETINNYLK